MISLSVNLNKIALLRNSRGGEEPSVLGAAKICLEAGCQGITVHPRSDQRHIRPDDVLGLKRLLSRRKGLRKAHLELNVEGRPTKEFLALVEIICPHQITLVPDSAGQLTSDHGWDFKEGAKELRRVIPQLKAIGARVALFANADPESIPRARDLGADRIELYTGPYADLFKKGKHKKEMDRLYKSAERALDSGLEVNAGHDLTVENLPALVNLPGLKEVSIGHHLIGRALEVGLSQSVLDYRKALGHKVESAAEPQRRREVL